MGTMMEILILQSIERSPLSQRQVEASDELSKLSKFQSQFVSFNKDDVELDDERS